MLTALSVPTFSLWTQPKHWRFPLPRCDTVSLLQFLNFVVVLRPRHSVVPRLQRRRQLLRRAPSTKLNVSRSVVIGRGIGDGLRAVSSVPTVGPAVERRLQSDVTKRKRRQRWRDAARWRRRESTAGASTSGSGQQTAGAGHRSSR